MSDAARQAFLARYGHVAEGSPWVAEEAWGLGPPDDDPDAVAEVFRRACRSASPERQLALIRAHPDLAGRAALAGDLTADSAAEQSSAGLDRLVPADLDAVTRLNAAYRERFGFPFVIRVAGRPVPEIIAAMRTRLGNDPDVERATAIDEIAQIIALRIAAA